VTRGTCRVAGYAGGIAVSSLPLDDEYREHHHVTARNILRDLEDRRVLFGRHNLEDAEHCRRSADLVRRFIGTALYAVPEGPLVSSLKRIRGASRGFISAAGKDSSDYLNDLGYFMRNLKAYRAAVGDEVGWIAFAFDIEVDKELASIIPDFDLVLL
jgi:hypothetical protein